MAATTDNGNTRGNGQDWLFGKVVKADAEEKLLADGGSGVSGKFLVRQKGADQDNYILSVIYKGAPTHHALARAGEGEEWTLNKTPTGCTEMEAVIAKYRSKQPNGSLAGWRDRSNGVFS